MSKNNKKTKAFSWPELPTPPLSMQRGDLIWPHNIYSFMWYNKNVGFQNKDDKHHHYLVPLDESVRRHSFYLEYAKCRAPAQFEFYYPQNCSACNASSSLYDETVFVNISTAKRMCFTCITKTKMKQ